VRREGARIGVEESRAAQDCFFFQAEDGIRDGHVTGVQTCALPISSTSATPTGISRSVLRSYSAKPGYRSFWISQMRVRSSPAARSEERRVGKERRLLRAPERSNRKQQQHARCGFVAWCW